MARKQFAIWNVGDEEYKLKLKTSTLCDLEEKLGTSLMNVLGNGNMPALKIMLTITHYAIKDYNANINFKDVQDLFDKYARLKLEEIIDLIKCLDSFECESLNQYITALRIEKYLSYEIGNLSKGTRKKISILMALLSKSSTILLDEPFESIDRESNLNFSKIVQKKSNNFIIVSHDIEYLNLATDKIYELRDGKLYE